jgi:hypothetical protein
MVALAAVAIGSVASVLVASGGPAAADPPRPTNFESRILSVDPPLDRAAVSIEGGDAFMVLTVEPGQEAMVPDYGDDDTERPYLRFMADGTVQVNERSAAASANDSRFGAADAAFDPEAEPTWRTVADGGTYAWHDHRIHLMVPDDMAVVDDRGRVDLGGPEGTWEVPLIVGGVDSVVRGELVRLDAPAPWPWYAVIVVLAATMLALVALAGPAPPWVWPTLLVLAAAAASCVSWVELSEAPEGSGASAVPLVIACASLVGAAIAVGARWLGPRAASLVLAGTALAASTLLWWGATRHAVLVSEILPSGLGPIDRAANAAAIGLGLATAVLLVWRPATLQVTTAPASSSED